METEKGLLYKYIVVIVRETLDGNVVTVTYFKENEEKEAKNFYRNAGAQWSDTYLCEIKMGPKV